MHMSGESKTTRWSVMLHCEPNWCKLKFPPVGSKRQPNVVKTKINYRFGVLNFVFNCVVIHVNGMWMRNIPCTSRNSSCIGIFISQQRLFEWKPTIFAIYYCELLWIRIGCILLNNQKRDIIDDIVDLTSPNYSPLLLLSICLITSYS